MRILITNDDGIYAPQLLALVRWTKKLGQVTVAAPKVEQSGKSHGIDLHNPFEVKKVDLEPGVDAYTVDSTPADCVRYMLLGRKESYDLVISGVNRGFNMGVDILYSGTAGAVFEAVALGQKAIALSSCPEYCEQVDQHLDEVFGYIFRHDLLSLNDAWNINIPPQGKEIRVTRQGGQYYSDDFEPVGNDLYKARGKCVYEDSSDDTLDTDAVMHGYISISPLTVCRTNMDVFRQMTHLNG